MSHIAFNMTDDTSCHVTNNNEICDKISSHSTLFTHGNIVQVEIMWQNTFIGHVTSNKTCHMTTYVTNGNTFLGDKKVLSEKNMEEEQKNFDFFWTSIR